MIFTRQSKLSGIALLTLLTVLVLPVGVSAQGRGRHAFGLDKKCEKFVNCHDARDGRWDGRGPRRHASLGNIIFGRNRRVRRIDDNGYYRIRRHDNHRSRGRGRF
ncbi:MAG: hypothetical protein ABR555_16335 [Pyrinomonadaceae bacterium]